MCAITAGNDNNDNNNAPPPTTGPPPSKIRIAVWTFVLNAGECTRAVEIATAVRALAKQQQQQQQQQQGLLLPEVELVFFTTTYSDDPTISYERFVTDAGFAVKRVGPETSRDQWREMLGREHDGKEFVAAEEVEGQAAQLRKSVAALAEYDPCVVLHGFLDGAMQAQILGFATIAYLPLPFTSEFMNKNLFLDIPEADQKYGISLLPKSLRRWLLHSVLAVPFLPTWTAQPNLRKVGVRAGWKVKGKGMLGDMCDADLVLINDLKGNYDGEALKANVRVTGPVFPHNDDTKTVVLDPEILKVFDPKHPNKKVFVSMGSSGNRECLLEAVRAVSTGGYHVVAVVPPTICPMDEFRRELWGGDGEPRKSSSSVSRVYLTDAFVPAKPVNRLADAAIIHGGQGTVQTAMGSGTPVVSIGFQPEQRFNLECVAKRGAGIRLERTGWNRTAIAAAMERVFGDPAFKASAVAVRDEMDASDGNAESAAQVLDFARSKLYGSN